MTKNAEHGSPEVLTHEVLRTVVGSGVHGLAIEGTDDHDEMGVYMQPPESLLGIKPQQDHYVSRTQPEGARSGPGDTDLVAYSLHKFVKLAVKGNPTVLVPLFASEPDVLTEHWIGTNLRFLRTSFLSKAAGERFLGYMGGQMERLQGRGSQRRVPNRPELVAKYGYDTKYASHALRLAIQGRELITTGHLTLPMDPLAREIVMIVKRGEVGYLEAVDQVKHWANLAESALRNGCVLPDEPDLTRINDFMIDAHLTYWEEKGL